MNKVDIKVKLKYEKPKLIDLCGHLMTASGQPFTAGSGNVLACTSGGGPLAATCGNGTGPPSACVNGVGKGS